MKILLVGSGGREHALAWKLLQSPNIEKVICTPGNGGTATLPGCQNIPIPVVDFEGIVKVAQEYNVSLVVIGPELPLSLGIGDRLASVGIDVFGPTQAGAQIEASKSWAKDLMLEAGVGTSRGAKFTNPKAAQAYVTQQGVPIVV
ncbi:MAG: phosphoribosylamine--glycine ligase, partial [Prochloron sp. SP5CPC1]|nr:phosphoribosylamine--glycine ligase [Candidatus Paraprochloron terpiosi SP5CPC1]